LHWGDRLGGLPVNLAATPAAILAEIIEEARRRKAPKRLIAAFDQRQSG
jgi:hypothetical protein